MKLRLQLRGPLKDLDDKPVAGGDMADVVGNMLGYGTEGDPVKCTMWAIDLKKNGYIDGSSEDREELKRLVLGAKGLQNFAKSRIVDALNASKEISSEK